MMEGCHGNDFGTIIYLCNKWGLPNGDTFYCVNLSPILLIE